MPELAHALYRFFEDNEPLYAYFRYDDDFTEVVRLNKAGGVLTKRRDGSMHFLGEFQCEFPHDGYLTRLKIKDADETTVERIPIHGSKDVKKGDLWVYLCDSPVTQE